MKTIERKVVILNSFSIKAVKLEGEIIGIVRFGAKKDRIAVKGITRYFCCDEQLTTLELSNFFFFGPRLECGELFNRRDIIYTDFLDKYIDREYSKYSASHSRLVHFVSDDKRVLVDMSQFIKVPLADLHLTEERMALIKQAQEKADQLLPKMLRELKFVVFSDLKSFKLAPSDLIELAFSAKNFYTASSSTSKKETEILTVPKTRIIYIPMNGLPEWSKRFMKEK